MFFDGEGEDLSFDFFSKFFESFDIVGVIDSNDILFDDWSLVELWDDIVGGSSDDFYSALVGFFVGFCSDE